MSNSAKKYLIISIISFFLLGAVFFYQIGKFNDGQLHIVFCNVGQGDGAYIRSPKGLDILIDGGPDASILPCLNNHMPFWDRTIEAIILSHPHADHMAGLIDVLQRYNALSFYTVDEDQGKTDKESEKTYQALLSILKNKKIVKKSLQEEDRLKIKDGLILTTVWPLNNSNQKVLGVTSDINKSSIIELLTYGKLRVLFTGDAGTAAKSKVQDIGQIDLVKVAHHGSKDSLDQNMLKVLRPKLAVISAGKNNRYHHPAESILKMLQDQRIKILRTDIDGEVEIVSDGEKWGIVE